MEELMQYIWQFRLWPAGSLRTADGHIVDVIDPGIANNGSGPDFFNAKIRIDRQWWAGNIEMHVRASDWYVHGHHTDKAYDNVILHVVQSDDGAVTHRKDAHKIPQVVMPGTEKFAGRLSALMASDGATMPCIRHLDTIPQLVLNDFMTAMAIERLQQKADSVMALVQARKGDWRAATFITLARGLGFGTNADAMEQLARSIPLDTVLRHSDNATAMEAILLGVAGMLDIDHPRDNYENILAREYSFYALKFGIGPATQPLWRTRLRPGAQPARRIAMLAAMMADGFPFGGKALNITSPADIHNLFDAQVSEYWHTHIAPAVTASGLQPVLGFSSRTLLAINVVAPIIYAYGWAIDDSARQEAAIELLQSLKPERNSLIAPFTQAGFPCHDAFTSQALLQLRKNYCQLRKCLFCRLGHRILATAARQPATL